ncbi:MAG: hypothetical protein KAR42_11960 [candidate division Zixibacteria bacterium]|nr:hypothetical protein [candidate division Zixibacteria bacterium]
MPKPPIDFYPHDQFTVQQYLHTICKVNVGALGKIDGKWTFGKDCSPAVRLSSRSDISQVFDFAEKKGILVEAPQEAQSLEGLPEGFVVYQLSQEYWDKLDKFAQ